MSACLVKKWADKEHFYWSCTNHGVIQARYDSRAARDQAAADHEKRHNPR